MSEKKEKPIASIISIVVSVILIIGSAGWLISNLDDTFGWLIDPIPTETVIPDDEETAGSIDAVLYAECQQQLREALEGIDPRPSDNDKEANAEYLAEAEAVHVRLRDLIEEGRILMDEMILAGEEDRIDDEFREEWKDTARQYRTDLYKAIERYRDLGVGNQFIRIHSELFVAYQYVDLFSDQINSYFVEGDASISSLGLNRAEAHLDTARDLLNR